jgi:hypothetical protein
MLSKEADCARLYRDDPGRPCASDWVRAAAAGARRQGGRRTISRAARARPGGAGRRERSAWLQPPLTAAPHRPACAALPPLPPSQIFDARAALADFARDPRAAARNDLRCAGGRPCFELEVSSLPLEYYFNPKYTVGRGVGGGWHLGFMDCCGVGRGATGAGQQCAGPSLTRSPAPAPPRRPPPEVGPPQRPHAAGARQDRHHRRWAGG